MSDSPTEQPSISEPSGEHRSPFHELLDIHSSAADGKSRIELFVDHRHLRSLGIAHGGVLATLLDCALGMAASSKAPADHYTVTVQLNCNFIRPAWEGETLIATGAALHVGRQTAVSRGEVHTTAGALVGSGSATCMFLAHTEKTRGKIHRREDS